MKPTKKPTQKRRKKLYTLLGPREVPDRDVQRVRLNAFNAGVAAKRAGGDFGEAYLEVYRVATGYYEDRQRTRAAVSKPRADKKELRNA
jgi:predicted GH43/DUF377 family glycosyl hydrolase